jgi:hypothetical protein
MRNIKTVYSENFNRKDYVGDLGEHGRAIIKYILQK